MKTANNKNFLISPWQFQNTNKKQNKNKHCLNKDKEIT